MDSLILLLMLVVGLQDIQDCSLTVVRQQQVTHNAPLHPEVQRKGIVVTVTRQ